MADPSLVRVLLASELRKRKANCGMGRDRAGGFDRYRSLGAIGQVKPNNLAIGLGDRLTCQIETNNV